MKKKIKIDVRHLAKLANVSISAKEEPKFQKQLEEILEFVDQLDELDTEKIKSTARVIKKGNVSFRDGAGEHQGCDIKLTKVKSLVGRKYFVVKKVKWE